MARVMVRLLSADGEVYLGPLQHLAGQSPSTSTHALRAGSTIGEAVGIVLAPLAPGVCGSTGGVVASGSSKTDHRHWEQVERAGVQIPGT